MSDLRDPSSPEPTDEEVAVISDLMQADEDDAAVYGWMVEEGETEAYSA